MYPHIIEIHREGTPVLIPISSIIYINGSRIHIAHKDIPIKCDEKYEQIIELITKCGCHIEFGDPRLDTKHPLKMEDLKKMIGEPIWNNNLCCWQLVREFKDNIIYLTYSAGNNIPMNEDDLIKYPIYSMKKGKSDE